MELTSQPNYLFAFGKTSDVPYNRENKYFPETQEREFQNLNSEPWRESVSSYSNRSRSADRVWGTETFGKGDFYYHRTEDQQESETKKSRFQDNTNIRGDLDNISKKVQKIKHEQFVEKEELRDTAKFDKGCVFKEAVKRGNKDVDLKVETGKKPVLSPFTTQDFRNSKGSKQDESQDRNEPRDYGEWTKAKEFANRSQQLQKKSHTLLIEKIPPIQPTSNPDSEDLGHSGAQIGGNEETSDMEGLLKELETLRRDNRRKERRIEELEGYLTNLISNIDAYNARLTNYIDLVKREAVGNNLQIYKLRENIFMLLENNSRIVELCHQNKLYPAGNSLVELGKEIEKNRVMYAKAQQDLDKMEGVVKTSQDRTMKLIDFTLKNLQESILNNEKLGLEPEQLKNDGYNQQIFKSFGEDKSMKGISGSAQDLNQSLLLQLSKNIQEDGDEVKRLKEDLKIYADNLEMKEKTINRMVLQIKDLQEFTEKYLKSEAGQLNSGLKNTARKLIDLQNQVEKGKAEKEALEGKIMNLNREKAILEGEITRLEKERHNLKNLEKQQRELIIQMRKINDKNEVLTELQTKNETIMAHHQDMLNELGTERLVLMQRLKDLEKRLKNYEPNYGFIHHNEINGLNYANRISELNIDFGKKTKEQETPLSTQSWDHNQNNIFAKYDEILEKKLSPIPKVDSQYKNVGRPSLEPNSYFHADTTESRPLSSLLSPYKDILASETKVLGSKQTESFNLEPIVSESPNSYKENPLNQQSDHYWSKQ